MHSIFAYMHASGDKCKKCYLSWESWNEFIQELKLKVGLQY